MEQSPDDDGVLVIPCDAGPDHEYVGLAYLRLRLPEVALNTLKSWMRREALPNDGRVSVGGMALWPRPVVDGFIEDRKKDGVRRPGRPAKVPSE